MLMERAKSDSFGIRVVQKRLINDRGGPRQESHGNK
jgi:hypothetical protein